MTRICNFPITKKKRCTQPIADDKPNCGRHSTDLAADQLGRRPTVYEKDGELHVWEGKPDGLYCLIHNDSSYQVLCQLAGETPPSCLREQIVWRDRRGRPHRDDGPAVIWLDGKQEWCRHGQWHREDGPAYIEPDGTQKWYWYDLLHRDDGPAQIWPDGTQCWWQYGKRHREDGPAVVWLNSKQQWWCQQDRFHRDDGPAVIHSDGSVEWWWHGEQVTEQGHARRRAQSEDI